MGGAWERWLALMPGRLGELTSQTPTLSHWGMGTGGYVGIWCPLVYIMEYYSAVKRMK